ncbi:HNH endonuclease [Clostridium tagluense]|uniref:HNH endonuclease 5 domain-containing protein n=1 Tax=Clostridium tagluense TaxID=360422 RepID=A0A401UL99_9CLOT|nr:HNH endonuclease [Clostridium tagluense]GCD10343.1 hypothetical protein Ctaglu_19660 [Clostridium tagluense]
MDYDELKNLQERVAYFTKKYMPLFQYTHNSDQTPLFDDKNNTCRFCGKSSPKVTFKKKAHAISELIGNKEFVSRNECDVCNEQFGNSFEDNLSKYLGITRNLSQIHSKKGVPSYKSESGKSRVDFTNKGIVIQDIEGSNFIEMKENGMLIHSVRQSYSPLSVYKSFVKMALSVLPYEYMFYFWSTVKWLGEKSDATSYYDMKDYEWIIERFVPGPRPLSLTLHGFIRNNDVIEVPFYQFVLEFGNYIYQIAVPCKFKDYNLGKSKNKITIYPMPHELEFIKFQFGKIETNFKVMNNPNKIKGEKLDVFMGFENCEIYDGNGKKIDDILKEEGINLKERLKYKPINLNEI